MHVELWGGASVAMAMTLAACPLVLLAMWWPICLWLRPGCLWQS